MKTLLESMWKYLTLFRMGLFGTAHGCRDQKGPHTYNLSHISCNNETWHSYTWPKEDLKNVWVTRYTFESCWHQHFLTVNQQILLYQEMQIKTAYWYIISSCFNLFWVFQHFFNKHGCNFDDVSKNSYSRPS